MFVLMKPTFEVFNTYNLDFTKRKKTVPTHNSGWDKECLKLKI